VLGHWRAGGFVAGHGRVVYQLWCVRSGLYCGRLDGFTAPVPVRFRWFSVPSHATGRARGWRAQARRRRRRASAQATPARDRPAGSGPMITVPGSEMSTGIASPVSPETNRVPPGSRLMW